MAPDARRQGIDDKVVVHGRNISVDRVTSGVPSAEVRHRFGGLDPLGVLAGLAAGIGSLVVLGSLLAAAGTGGYGQVESSTLGIAALVGGLIALGLSLLFGGYVAGRVARYAGLLNGLLTGLAFLLVSAGLAALASSTDEASRLELPGWLDRGDATTAAVVTSLIALALVLGASALGGWLGEKWHRKPDSLLAGTRAGALTPYAGDAAHASGAAVLAPTGSASPAKKARR